MTTYKTGNPLGSAAVKDLFDNAENLDHFENDRSNETWENRFGVPGKTRYGMEQEHDRQISSQEARFQQFLLSSGYVFLGDYLDGPFQFSARNQYIRYNNQYYRLNAATDVGFTTTGTDATSFANDVTHFVLMDGDTLRQNLSSSDGASLIGGLGFLTPEMFSENITLDDDFSFALHRTIEAAKNGPVKLIILGSLYKISSSFDIPDGVTIRGGGPETGVYLEKAPAEPMHIIFNMACVGSRLENFGVYFNTGGQGSISAVQVYGVFLQANSKDCTINGLTINGKPGDTVMGFSNGIRCTGAGNKILFCDIQYCSMGITARGDKHQITRNYCNNHFVDENLSAWSSSSPYWDGITAEGLSNSLIADNICEYNGQSGIYIGGNNSLSYDNIISRNTIRYNFNRGIDNGVSGTVSTTNSVLRNIITSNVIYDNREPQLWLFNANDFVVDGNSVRITSNYASIFGSYVSSSTSGIATGGTSISGVIISNNRVIVDYASALYRVVLNGTNMKYVHNTVTGTPPDYMWSIDANRLYNNTISRFQGTFKPTLLSGTGVTVTAATGYYSINDKVLRFSMQLTLSGSTPSGNLVFGYLPGMSSATIRISLVSANNATGWNTMTGSLKAYQDGTNKDQIIVYRDTGGVRNLDAAAYVGAASTILITGEIEVASTY
ncbi:right-handed parallel beta-helix repeat-containing protein [Klebsiella pneumoniae]|uniref:right-handed parallel beta-helix repeat-containing protein n=1 Tax=Klebsiella pneumoniae TaxID=573 RepID=UPI0010352776|nr:right-handed parallel beta-helix repeat-containing protein [Klebsiella pneumoniae]MDP0651283.1 right-handed parallel beta-helix repeat-containing protein [Klebsiella pneumoniae]MDP0743625.1 right-handed parallel beta-helix repeat-containing protein [Klebsiella pneumoniae]HCT7149120.1 right-handed parallel beta-helix repeat-containing protein [Klebsiella pneumoniae]